MKKKHKEPGLPEMPIEWIDNAAQNAGCVVERVRSDRGTVSKRRYREHILERMAKERDGLKRISSRQMLAGLELHDAWCRTMLSPPAVREIVVDSTPRPDDITVNQVQAMQRYADLIATVPSDMRPVVRHVACENRAIRDGVAFDSRSASSALASLQVALDLLANHLGY